MLYIHCRLPFFCSLSRHKGRESMTMGNHLWRGLESERNKVDLRFHQKSDRPTAGMNNEIWSKMQAYLKAREAD